MIVHALIGESGTGKSTSALQFAHEHNIEGIIDDGILIVNGYKVAGTSAKFEKNSIKAIRRAIFQDEDHKNEVIEAIQNRQIQSILIIATSKKMANRIAERLELGPIEHIHYIDQIRTKREIQVAKFVRNTKGQHVMPIPFRQIEQNFFKRIIRRGKEIFGKNRVKLGETTLVRPDFHSEVVHIHHSVYIQLLKYCMKKYENVIKTQSVHFEMNDFQTLVTIHCFLKQPIHYNVLEKMEEVQKLVADEFMKHFQFEPEGIIISIKGTVS